MTSVLQDKLRDVVAAFEGEQEIRDAADVSTAVLWEAESRQKKADIANCPDISTLS